MKNLSPYFLLFLFNVVPIYGSQAQIFTPLIAGSKYACASLANGKNGVGVVSGNSYKLTTSFTKISTAIANARTKERARRDTIKELLQDIKKGTEGSGFLSQFNRLIKDVLDTSGNGFRTDKERIEALNQTITAVNGRIKLRDLELKALQNCKSNKKPSSLEASYKVVLLPDDPNSVVVLGIVPASLVKAGVRYCGSVTSYGLLFNPTNSPTRLIGGGLGANPCSPRNCSGTFGVGYLGIYVFGSFGISPANRDKTIADLESGFSGGFTLKELKDNESCG